MPRGSRHELARSMGKYRSTEESGNTYEARLNELVGSVIHRAGTPVPFQIGPVERIPVA
jgi:hypothetical protein